MGTVFYSNSVPYLLAVNCCFKYILHFQNERNIFIKYFLFAVATTGLEVERTLSVDLGLLMGFVKNNKHLISTPSSFQAEGKSRTK